MAKTKKVDLSAFNNVLDGLGDGNVMHQEEVSDTTNDIIDNDDIDNLDNNDDITSDVNAEDNESTNQNFEDNTKIPEDILNDTNNTTSDSNEDNNSEQNATTEVNENEDKLKIMGENGRKCLVDNYSKSLSIQKYREAIYSILEEK